MDRFEDANGAPFLVGGVPYVDFVEAQVHEHESHQIQERTAKAQAKKQEVRYKYLSRCLFSLHDLLILSKDLI